MRPSSGNRGGHTHSPPPVVVRALLLLAAAGAAAAGFVLFALGTCHDSGGFCAEEFGSTHAASYAGGSLLLGAGGASAAAAFLRLRPALICGAATAGAVALAAVFLEMS